MDLDFSKISRHVITSDIPIDTFECLEPSMKKFINEEAMDDQKNMLGNTICWVLDKKILLGFISLATYSIDKKLMADDKGEPLQYQTIPALLVGKLAAHKDYSGHGLGDIMLNYAIKTAYNASKNAGCRLLVLQTLNAKAEKWYIENTSLQLISRKNNGKSIMYIDLLKK